MREGARERGSEQGGRESPHSLFGQAKVAPAVEGVSIINPEKVINAEIFPKIFFHPKRNFPQPTFPTFSCEPYLSVREPI